MDNDAIDLMKIFLGGMLGVFFSIMEDFSMFESLVVVILFMILLTLLTEKFKHKE